MDGLKQHGNTHIVAASHLLTAGKEEGERERERSRGEG